MWRGVGVGRATEGVRHKGICLEGRHLQANPMRDQFLSKCAFLEETVSSVFLEVEKPYMYAKLFSLQCSVHGSIQEFSN